MLKSQQFITNYLKAFKINKLEWNYEDGCVLMGCVQLYEATKDKLYQKFVLEYLEKFIGEDGAIKGYDKTSFNIDSINTGKILFYAYEWTEEERYREGICRLMEQLKEHPRTPSGSFWHKKIYPNQIWLDGLYMAQPFYMMYETRFGAKENYGDIIRQFQNVRNNMYDKKKGLYYHGYDESKTVFWADKDTGTSPNFWLRSMGWYLMAMIDVIEVMDKTEVKYLALLKELFQEAIEGLLAYQDSESRLFYQVIDHPEVKENYLETSGSAMVGYALLKGCVLGVLSKEDYQKTGLDIVDALTERMVIEKEGHLLLSGNCAVAGLGPQGDTRRDGSIVYYLSEPVTFDDRKGVGAYMMACAQKLKSDR
jgi:unsaturated rhamnogalacturonyl hydrolase